MKLINVKEACISHIAYKITMFQQPFRKLYKKTSCNKRFICVRKIREGCNRKRTKLIINQNNCNKSQVQATKYLVCDVESFVFNHLTITAFTRPR